MKISVGVVIPVHNRPEGAREAVESALNQSLPPQRVVVVDDGSDPPLALPSSLAADPRVTLLRLEQNSGAAAARQAGLDALDTSHVAFLDSDDLWASGKLKAQVKLIEELGEAERTAVSCGWFWVDPRRKLGTVMPRASAALKDFVGGCWFCPGSTVLMPLDLLRRIGGFDPELRRLEDLDLFIRFAAAGGGLAVVAVPLATVSRARHASRADVDAAAARLREKYGPAGPAPLSLGLRRRLDAWLAVEEAAAARNEGQYGRMVARLFHSFRMAPRLRLQLERWRQRAG